MFAHFAKEKHNREKSWVIGPHMVPRLVTKKGAERSASPSIVSHLPGVPTWCFIVDPWAAVEQTWVEGKEEAGPAGWKLGAFWVHSRLWEDGILLQLGNQTSGHSPELEHQDLNFALSENHFPPSRHSLHESRTWWIPAIFCVPLVHIRTNSVSGESH